VRTYIHVLSGEASGEAVLLDKPFITCGRHHENDLVLPDNDVSRHHCRFVRVSSSTYRIEDAGSSNGTYVNDSLVQNKILFEGSQVRVGRTLLKLVSVKESAFGEDDWREQLSGFSLGADLEPEIETAKPVLNSPVESYTEVASEQNCFELEVGLDFVWQASAISSANLTLDGLCHNLVKLVTEWAGVSQALFVLLDENEQDFAQTFVVQPPIEDSPAQSPQQSKFKFNRGLVDRVLVSRLPTMIEFEVSTDRRQNVTAMCVPVDNGQKLLGLIYVDDFQSPGGRAGDVFSSAGLEVFAGLGRQAAAAIDNNVYVQSALVDASQNAVRKLTSVVSHRMNNLMHLVSGGEFLIEAGLKSNDLKQVADGWGTVRRAQSRISHLSTNMAWHCREFNPSLQEAKPIGIINVITDDMSTDYGEMRLNVDIRVAPNLSLNLASHCFERAVRNILAVGFWAAGHGPVGQDTVTLEIKLSGEWFVIRVSFRHFDARFNLAELGTGEINSVNAEFGFLEMLVAKKILASQAGSLTCSTDSENLNMIEVRLPLVSQAVNAGA